MSWLCAGLLVWLQTPQEQYFVDRVAVKVNDKIITQRELLLVYELKKRKLLESQTSGNLDEQFRALWQQTVDEAVEQLLLYEKAVELGVAISDDALESRMQSIKESNGFSDEEFEQILKAQTGMSIDEYVASQRREESAQRVIHSQVLSQIEIEEAEISKYYDEHQDTYMEPATYRIAEIVFLKREEPALAKFRALACQESLNNGTPFAQAAKTYSDSVSKENGGDLGDVEFGDLNPVIEKAAEQLEINGVSDILESGSAYFIIKVLNKKPAKPVPIDQVKDDIRMRLRQPRLEAKLMAFLEELKESFIVETLVEEPPKIPDFLQ